MSTKITWSRSKSILLCMDSDGCAMDTMDVKHKTCFGPQMIECYGLEEHRAAVQSIWDRINLYSQTRGINRFLGLVATLREIENTGLCRLHQPYDRLAAWTENSRQLSNPALEAEVEKGNDPQLALALQWSHRVNQAIAALPEDHGAYPGVSSALQTLSRSADLAVVSSANSEALQSEWQRCELDSYVQALLGQECGSKAFCIAELLRLGGYDKTAVLMVGDAPGDLKAAEVNGVGFYPILVGREEFSWQRLCEEAIGKLIDGQFLGAYQAELKQEFLRNLS